MVAEPAWVDLDALIASLRPMEIPDASAPLSTALLHADPAGRCLLVRFPAGWERGPGAFECSEVAVMLDGRIELDDVAWSAGQGFIVPAGVQRARTVSPEGAVAVAWFGGAPRWHSGPDAGPPAPGGPTYDWPGSPKPWQGSIDVLDAAGRQWAHVDGGDQTVRPDHHVYCWSAP